LHSQRFSWVARIRPQLLLVLRAGAQLSEPAIDFAKEFQPARCGKPVTMPKTPKNACGRIMASPKFRRRHTSGDIATEKPPNGLNSGGVEWRSTRGSGNNSDCAASHSYAASADVPNCSQPAPHAALFPTRQQRERARHVAEAQAAVVEFGNEAFGADRIVLLDGRADVQQIGIGLRGQDDLHQPRIFSGRPSSARSF
jgi:hypothetical protein